MSSTPTRHRLNLGYLTIIEEGLLKVLKSNSEFNTAPSSYVLHRTDGTLYSDRGGIWTMDLSEAKLFTREGSVDDVVLDAVLTPVTMAQSHTNSAILKQIEEIGRTAKRKYDYLRR